MPHIFASQPRVCCEPMPDPQGCRAKTPARGLGQDTGRLLAGRRAGGRRGRMARGSHPPGRTRPGARRAPITRFTPARSLSPRLPVAFAPSRHDRGRAERASAECSMIPLPRHPGLASRSLDPAAGVRRSKKRLSVIGCRIQISPDVSGQWSVDSGQWSVVSGQWSVVSGQ